MQQDWVSVLSYSNSNIHYHFKYYTYIYNILDCQVKQFGHYTLIPWEKYLLQIEYVYILGIQSSVWLKTKTFLVQIKH